MIRQRTPTESRISDGMNCESSLLQIDEGTRHCTDLDEPLDCRRVSSPVAALLQRSIVIGMPNQKDGMRPITLQKSCFKLVEAALCQHWDKVIRSRFGITPDGDREHS